MYKKKLLFMRVFHPKKRKIKTYTFSIDMNLKKRDNTHKKI